MAATRFRESFSDHILEVRYKPNATVLDHRGTWATILAEKLAFPNWRIDKDRVDLANEDGSKTAFVSFRNAGFGARDLTQATDFSRNLISFLRELFNLPGFGRSLFVNRLGVRSKWLTRFDGSFAQLRELYVQKCLHVRDAYRGLMGGTLEDIGAPLNFHDDSGRFNTSSGPMEKEQATQFFVRAAEAFELFDVALFLDIDYVDMPEESRRVDYFIQKVPVFCERAWAKYEGLKRLLEAE